MQNKKALILNILDILKRYTDENHRLNVSDIVIKLENEYDMVVERKAVKRNLVELSSCGYSVECSESTRKRSDGTEEAVCYGWYLSRDFTDAELRLIIDSLLFSKHIPANQRKRLIEKVEGLSNCYFGKRMKHVHSVQNGEGHNPELFFTIELLDEAISNGLQVRFEYCEFGTDKKLHSRLCSDGSVRKYIVNPYQMVATNGKYYLIGNYDKYDDVTHYRLDKIKKIEILSSSLKPQYKVKGFENGLDIASHMNEHIYMYGGESGVVVFRAKKYIISEIIDWFGKDVRFFNESADEVSVSVRVNYNAMKYWAIQYGIHIKVISPEFLVEEIKNDALAIAEKYNK